MAPTQQSAAKGIQPQLRGPVVLMPPAWTDERVETLKRRRLEGATASQIARELGDGFTRNSVIGKVSRLQLQDKSRSRAFEPEVDRIIIACWESGLNATETNGVIQRSGFLPRSRSSIRSRRRVLVWSARPEIHKEQEESISDYIKIDARWDKLMAAEGRKREGTSNARILSAGVGRS